MEEKKRWYAQSAESVASALNTSLKGLTSEEARRRNDSFGLNQQAAAKKDSAAQIFFRQFKSFIVLVLSAAALLSLLTGHYIEVVVIITITLFVVLLGFFEEFKAARDMDALIRLSPTMTRVLRDGRVIEIETSLIAPGDIIVLRRGDIVPADARLVEVNNIRIDESILTGESGAVEKRIILLAEELGISQQQNMVFAGTKVLEGNGLAIAVEIGNSTEIGKISKMLSNIRQEKTPLQQRLEKMGKTLSVIAIIISMMIFIIGIVKGVSWEDTLLFSLAVLISGIPESLPAVVTVTLAAGVKKMASRNAILKRLPAVETLGTCTVICTDKTGTLTQNKMLVETIFTSDTEVKVTGDGYSPEGVFMKEEVSIDPRKHETLSKMLEIGVMCNNAEVRQKEGEWFIDGEATEGALIVLGRKAGMRRQEMHSLYPRTKEHPFDPSRKCMSVVHKVKNEQMVYSKGAPEMLIENCSYYFHRGKVLRLTKEVKELFVNKTHEYAEKGLRVLGLAYKAHKGSFEQLKHVESGLIFVGLVSIRDPPHEGVKEAIQECKNAGIRVVMITGDNEVTAKAIARELGIFSERDVVMTGSHLDSMDRHSFERIADDVTVFARVEPRHKLRIVDTLQNLGNIVAMTGDGVNDAPALKKADIGIAMGKTGTEVAKEAAEMVLKDDNFKTIVGAIEEGRTIYLNVRKFVYYLLLGNFAEVILVIVAVLAGVSLPLTALMILFLNLATSEVPALGMSIDSPPEDIMKQKPRNPKEGILSDYLLLKIANVVPLAVLGTLFLYLWEIVIKKNTLPHAQTVAFATIILFELFHVLNARAWDESVFTKRTLSNVYVTGGIILSVLMTLIVIYVPFLQNIFGTVALLPSEWVTITLVASSLLFFMEIQKTIITAEIKEREKMKISPTRG
ncbi:MAG TPA: HAD-IC family P-type ATPase [Candidatus Nanoarchaeia archaeon]|nr:HAD-IC family P-type ATPase [Candidatus Nanoarchaeia archaeon]